MKNDQLLGFEFFKYINPLKLDLEGQRLTQITKFPT